MKSRSVTIFTVFVLSIFHGSIAQQIRVAEMITGLQNPATSDEAVKEIEAGDAELKTSVADNLFSLMKKEKNDTVLNNESKLAGELKVTACIPILVNRFVHGDMTTNWITASIMWSMSNDPAGRALVQIGDPVIPFMSKLLASDEKYDREKAIRVLGNIDSPAALAILKQHRSLETDEQNQHVIDKVTAPRN